MGSKNRKVQKVRYAVVGLGHLAQVAVLPAFARLQNAEIAALVTSDKRKAGILAKRYRVKDVYDYDQYEECLARDVDAVYIVLPNHQHCEFTMRAAKAGVHVLCEKPMAVSVAECRKMISSMHQHRRKLMIAYRLHFEKSNLESIAVGQSSKLGRVRFFSSDFGQQIVGSNVRLTEPTREGGGPIFDMGIYCINAARYLFRAEPTEVWAASASTGEARFRNAEEMTAVTMRFPGERLATFTASFGCADIGRYTLVGTKGVLTADPAYEYAQGLKLQIKVGEKMEKRQYSKRDQFAAEISYFSECILKNREPEPSGQEGLADIRVIEGIYKAVKSRSVVKLSAFEKKRRPSMRQEIRKQPHGKPETIHITPPSGSD
jgi:glucose-fructose oxidoreductase